MSKRLISLIYIVASEAVYDDTLDFKDHGTVLDHRTSLCDRAAAVRNRSIPLEDALRGIHLNMITPLHDPVWFDEPTGNSDPEKMTGFHVRLAAALAKEAGFTYRIYSAPLSAFRPLLWTEFLKRSLDKFDINLHVWSNTRDLLQNGIGAPYGLFDVSLLSAQHIDVSEPGFKSSLEGYSDLWPWAFFVYISIMVYLLRFRISLGLLRTSSCSQVLQPVVVISALLVLLLTFSYLWRKRQHQQVKHDAVCTSLDSCVSSGERVCVEAGTVTDEWLSHSYEHLQGSNQLVRCEGSPWKCEKNGECEVVVEPVTQNRVARQGSEYNGACTMRQMGHVLQPGRGGWMIKKIDHHDKCSYLIGDVLELYMHMLDIDGTLSKLVADLPKVPPSGVECHSNSFASHGENSMVGYRLDFMDWHAPAGLGIYWLSWIAMLLLCCSRIPRRILCRHFKSWPSDIVCQDVSPTARRQVSPKQAFPTDRRQVSSKHAFLDDDEESFLSACGSGSQGDVRRSPMLSSLSAVSRIPMPALSTTADDADVAAYEELLHPAVTSSIIDEFCVRGGMDKQDARHRLTARRFCVNHKGDVINALRQMESHQAWRSAFLAQAPPRVHKNFLHRTGWDRQGHPILFWNGEEVHSVKRSLEEIVYLNNSIILETMDELEGGEHLDQLGERPAWRLQKCTVILYMPPGSELGLGTIYALAKVLVQQFPERLYRLLIFPVNNIGLWLFGAVKKFLPETIVNRIHLLEGGKTPPRLLEFVAPEFLPPEFGGGGSLPFGPDERHCEP